MISGELVEALRLGKVDRHAGAALIHRGEPLLAERIALRRGEFVETGGFLKVDGNTGASLVGGAKHRLTVGAALIGGGLHYT